MVWLTEQSVGRKKKKSMTGPEQQPSDLQLERTEESAGMSGGQVASG